jgi:hypothetical protein
MSFFVAKKILKADLNFTVIILEYFKSKWSEGEGSILNCDFI